MLEFTLVRIQIFDIPKRRHTYYVIGVETQGVRIKKCEIDLLEVDKHIRPLQTTGTVFIMGWHSQREMTLHGLPFEVCILHH